MRLPVPLGRAEKAETSPRLAAIACVLLIGTPDAAQPPSLAIISLAGDAERLDCFDPEVVS